MSKHVGKIYSKPRGMRNAITAREYDAERTAELRTRRFAR